MKSNNLVYILTLSIIVLIIIIYFYERVSEKDYIYNEVICLGSGVSSAYICYKLKKDVYKKKILVLERENVMGGRLYSVFSDENKTESLEVTYDELGAMRLFKENAMNKVFDLLSEFKIDTIPVGLEDKNNIFYYEGEHLKKENIRLENGITFEEMKQTALNNVRLEYPDFTYETVLEYPEIVKMNIYDYFGKYANISEEDINKFKTYDGYDFLDKDTSISVYLIYGNWLTAAKSDQQVYIKDGIVTIVKKMFEKSNSEIIFNTNAVYIEKTNDNYNLIHTINKNHEYKCYKCKYLFLGVTPKTINELNTIRPLPISNLRLNMINQTKGLPLMKIFLKYDKDKLWWREKGFKQGKSTTDLEARMVHYYNDENILIYNSGPYATSLYLKFLENPSAAAKYVNSMIKKIHPFEIPEPNYVFTLWKYWADGAYVWKNNANIKLNINEIPNGEKDKSNIYIVGDSYSKYQGWIIGSIETADISLADFYSTYNKK
jgi:monoamine oxidase